MNRRPFDTIVRGSVGVVASLHALSLYAPKPLIGLNAALFTAWNGTAESTRTSKFQSVTWTTVD